MSIAVFFFWLSFRKTTSHISGKVCGGGSGFPRHASATFRKVKMAWSVLSPLHRAYKTIEDDDLKFPLIYGEGKKVRCARWETPSVLSSPKAIRKSPSAPPPIPPIDLHLWLCRKPSPPLFPRTSHLHFGLLIQWGRSLDICLNQNVLKCSDKRNTAVLKHRLSAETCQFFERSKRSEARHTAGDISPSSSAAAHVVVCDILSLLDWKGQIGKHDRCGDSLPVAFVQLCTYRRPIYDDWGRCHLHMRGFTPPHSSPLPAQLAVPTFSRYLSLFQRGAEMVAR